MTTDPVLRAAPAALALEHIWKRFGGLPALQDVTLHLRAGTVHALLGENGAGKTTLMRIAYGLLESDAGTLFVDGHPVRFTQPRDAIAAGIGMVHQHFSLVPRMTVAENIALGGRGKFDLAHVAERVREISNTTGFALDPAARIETLSVGAQQRVEIAKALARRARILILDEPTAVLAPPEIAELLRWLRVYVDAGHAAVLITHKLREALSVADDVTVLRQGRTARTGPIDACTGDSLAAAMLGEEGASSASAVVPPPRSPSDSARVVFRADRLTLHDASGARRVHDATFRLRGGELVGIVGVEGSGQRELLRALAGRLAPSAGTVEHPANVGFIPEDRHRDAILSDRSLTENLALCGLGARRGLIDWKQRAEEAKAQLREYDVRVADPRASMRSLSGGNQQKVVLARELSADSRTVPEGIVAENPTRGLDVRATRDIHARLRAACVAGACVIVYSSDVDEVLQLATRVLVLYAGRVQEVGTDREAVGRAMVGTAR